MRVDFKKQMLELEIQDNKKQLLRNHLVTFEVPIKIAKNASLLDLEQLRPKYKKLIISLSQSKQISSLVRQKRIKINQSYEYLCRTHNNIEYNQIQENLIKLVIDEDICRLARVLKSRPQYVNYKLKGSNYPLIYFAVRCGCYQIVELILKMGCSLDFKGCSSTPMHCASYYGHHQIICLLLQHGVPLNILNKFGNLPIQEAANQDIRDLLADAEKDNIYKLIQELIDEKLCLSTFNFKNDEKIIARKVILNNSKDNFDDYQDAFHGTSFKNLKSIAKNGLRKIGDIVDGMLIKLVDGHSKNEKWGKAVFVSPSILYSGHPVYAKQIINTTNKKTQIWLPIVQVKVKKQSYQTSRSTVKSFVSKSDQPQIVEYRVEMDSQASKQKVKVVALLFVQKQYLDSAQSFTEVIRMFLSNNQ